MANLSPRPRRRRGALFRLSVFILVTAALTGYVAVQIGRVDLGGGYRLQATFDDVSGLQAGDQVKIAGTPVGRVEKISVVDGRARVRLSVRDTTTLPADTGAAIRWRDIVGRRVVYLLPGTSRDRLRPGAHITRTTSVTDLGALLDDIAPLTGLDPGQINQVLSAIARMLDGNSAEITRLIANVDTVAATLAARRQVLSRMLGDYATVTGVLARRDQQIARLVDSTVALSDAVVRNRRLIEDALIRLSTTVSTTDTVLGRNAEEAGRIIARLSALTSGTRRNLDLLTEIMDGSAPKLRRMFGALDNGRFAVAAVSCVSFGPPPCPYGQRLPGPQQGTDRHAQGQALRRLILGDG